MDINNYVYHVTFGLGIVKELSYGEIKVVFLNGMPKTFMRHQDLSKYFDVIDPVLVKAIMNFEDRYNESALIKGKEYFNENKVGNITFESDSFYCDVTGTHLYSVLVKLKHGNISYSCNCPVNGVCKHFTAVLYKAKYLFLELKKLVEPTNQ